MLSMPSSRMHTKPHLSSQAINSNSTQVSRVILDNSKVMVPPKVLQDLNIPIILKDKVSNMEDIDLRSLALHSPHNKGLMDMTRGSMEITSSENVILVSSTC